MLEVVIAVLSVIIGAAITEAQTQKQNERAAHETYIRHLFQAVRDRFGITYDQLNQQLDKLGLKLNQLTEATRGSARISRASRIYRDFISQYPDKVSLMNQQKNEIQNLMNQITSTEEAAASKIQKGGENAYTKSDATEDAIGLVMQGNSIINKGQNNGVQQIDTSLVNKMNEAKEAEELKRQEMTAKIADHMRGID